MSWSLPKIIRYNESARYSKFFIILMILFCLISGIACTILNTPLERLYSHLFYEYRVYLLGSLIVLFFLIAIYAFPIEHNQLKKNIWNRWRARDLTNWQDWSLISYKIKNVAILSSYQPLIDDVQKTINLEQGEFKMPLLENSSALGLLRFDLICRQLINKIRPSLNQLTPKSVLSVYIQIDEYIGVVSSNAEQQKILDLSLQQIISRFEFVWKQADLRQQIDVFIVNDEKLIDDLYSQHAKQQTTSLVITTKYRTVKNQNCDEIATITLLLPDNYIKSKTLSAYRMMYSAVDELQINIKQLIESRQQPLDSITGIFFAGLSDTIESQLTMISTELNLPLNKDSAPFGLFKFDKITGKASPMLIWYLQAIAANTLKNSQQSCLLIAGIDEQNVILQIIGKCSPLIENHDYDKGEKVFPLGSLSISVAFFVPMMIAAYMLFPQLNVYYFIFLTLVMGVGISLMVIYFHRMLCEAMMMKQYDEQLSKITRGTVSE